MREDSTNNNTRAVEAILSIMSSNTAAQESIVTMQEVEMCISGEREMFKATVILENGVTVPITTLKSQGQEIENPTDNTTKDTSTSSMTMTKICLKVSIT